MKQAQHESTHVMNYFHNDSSLIHYFFKNFYYSIGSIFRSYFSVFSHTGATQKKMATLK